MSDILLQRAASTAQDARRNPREGNGETRIGPAGGEQPAARSLLVDLAALPAGQPLSLSEEGVLLAPAKIEEKRRAYYQDDLDEESVRKLALLVKEQLSLQALSIANAHAMGLLGLVRDISLM